MDKVYANPVGIIKKDIYIIRNNINGKVYIGQSQNATRRFKEHCKSSNSGSIISKAIQKYGKENFSLEIIERQISNYNEREQFWINHYNSIVPNGYNILEGGNSPPIFRGENSSACILSDDRLKELKDDLINTNLSYNELGIKYGISKRQVFRINHGTSRISENEQYPLRKYPNINGKLTNEDIECIIYLLKYTYLFNGEIARRFNVEPHAISKINSGKAHRLPSETYPIRNWKSSGVILFTYEQVTEIIELLKNSNLSLNKIAKLYNVNVQAIQGINNGSSKKYRRDEIIYPIRSY